MPGRTPTGPTTESVADSETDPATERTSDGASHATDETERRTQSGDDSGVSLVGTDLAIGYPTTDEPVVECERVDLPAGEVTALVGPNGSGKSTLLKGLADQLSPDRGTVYLDGQAVADHGSKELARSLGLLSQENEAPGSISVEELVYHGRYPHRGFLESVTEEDAAAVERAMELAGVTHLRDRPTSDLSGGQKQLVWIALVLAQDTDVLLLDEPTTYLDLHHQLTVLDVVRQLNEETGVTVGIVLHDIGQAARYADNVVAMRDGELVDWGPPADVITETLLERVFGVVATVESTPTGPRVIPHRPVEE